MPAALSPFEIAQLWIDFATLVRRVVALRTTDPPATVMDRALNGLFDVYVSLQPLTKHKASTNMYRRAMRQVYEELGMVSLLLDVSTPERR
jgi:hypothetical protein